MPSEADRQAAPDVTRLATDQARKLVAAWHRWRGGELLPTRSALNLDGIKDLLPLVMLLEVQSTRSIVFRLAGSAIDASLGVAVTGTNFLDYVPSPHRELRAVRMMRQAAQPCGARSVISFTFAGGYEAPIELVALPVRPDEPGRPMQLICVAAPMAAERVTLGDPSMAPLRGGAAVYEYFDIGAGLPELD